MQLYGSFMLNCIFPQHYLYLFSLICLRYVTLPYFMLVVIFGLLEKYHLWLDSLRVKVDIPFMFTLIVYFLLWTHWFLFEIWAVQYKGRKWFVQATCKIKFEVRWLSFYLNCLIVLNRFRKFIKYRGKFQAWRVNNYCLIYCSVFERLRLFNFGLVLILGWSISTELLNLIIG